MGKKVGILTFHWANHFGAVLQAWALNKLLIDNGFDAEIINFSPVPALLYKRVLKPNELARKYQTMGVSSIEVVLDIAKVINYIYNLKNEMCKNRLFNNFRQHFMRISSEVVNNINELMRQCAKYDVCLVGSDQVLNPEFLRHSDLAYLLPFHLEGKKIAFSASIAENIPLNMINLYKITLSDFAFVSVREKSHSRSLSSLLGREVYNTLDPTLLLEIESYAAIMNKNLILPYDRYVLVYNLGFSFLPLAKEIVDAIKLPAILYNKLPPLSIKRKLAFSKYFKTAPSFFFMGPREFLTLLRNAEFVITDSFHGTALSILFEKPFITTVTGLNVKRKSRLLDLLELFKLSKRIFILGESQYKDIIYEPINYNYVRKLLNGARRESLELLTLALKG